MILYVSFLLHYNFKNMIFRFLFIFLKDSIVDCNAIENATREKEFQRVNVSEKVFWTTVLVFSSMQTWKRKFMISCNC